MELNKSYSIEQEEMDKQTRHWYFKMVNPSSQILYMLSFLSVLRQHANEYHVYQKQDICNYYGTVVFKKRLRKSTIEKLFIWKELQIEWTETEQVPFCNRDYLVESHESQPDLISSDINIIKQKQDFSFGDHLKDLNCRRQKHDFDLQYQIPWNETYQGEQDDASIKYVYKVPRCGDILDKLIIDVTSYCTVWLQVDGYNIVKKWELDNGDTFSVLSIYGLPLIATAYSDFELIIKAKETPKVSGTFIFIDGPMRKKIASSTDTLLNICEINDDLTTMKTWKFKDHKMWQINEKLNNCVNERVNSPLLLQKQIVGEYQKNRLYTCKFSIPHMGILQKELKVNNLPHNFKLNITIGNNQFKDFAFHYGKQAIIFDYEVPLNVKNLVYYGLDIEIDLEKSPVKPITIDAIFKNQNAFENIILKGGIIVNSQINSDITGTLNINGTLRIDGDLYTTPFMAL